MATNRNIGRDDNGIYTCYGCGNKWSDKPIWLWWPIHLKLYWTRHKIARWRVGSHGIEVGAYHFGQRVLMRVVQVGPLRIIFGSEEYRYKADTPATRAIRYESFVEAQDYLTKLEGQ